MLCHLNTLKERLVCVLCGHSVRVGDWCVGSSPHFVFWLTFLSILLLFLCIFTLINQPWNLISLMQNYLRSVCDFFKILVHEMYKSRVSNWFQWLIVPTISSMEKDGCFVICAHSYQNKQTQESCKLVQDKRHYLFNEARNPGGPLSSS